MSDKPPPADDALSEAEIQDRFKRLVGNLANTPHTPHKPHKPPKEPQRDERD